MLNDFDIAKFAADFSKGCTKCQVKNFNKGETITTYLVNRNQFCILLSGNADLVRYDINGNRIVTEHFSRKCYLSAKYFMTLIQTVNLLLKQKIMQVFCSSLLMI